MAIAASEGAYHALNGYMHQSEWLPYTGCEELILESPANEADTMLKVSAFTFKYPYFKILKDHNSELLVM